MNCPLPADHGGEGNFYFSLFFFGVKVLPSGYSNVVFSIAADVCLYRLKILGTQSLLFVKLGIGESGCLLLFRKLVYAVDFCFFHDILPP